MLFNSIEFLFFLPLVFCCYWMLSGSRQWQNLFVVAASYLFYGWWDWRFLLLIAFTSFCSYWSGILLQKNDGNRRVQKWISAGNISLNLFILGLFKYFNFFSENLAALFRSLGYEPDWVMLDVLLPVGISFYTFQALSYTIDVYRKRISPTCDIVTFFAYISFFPQLVAGPIERATNLLPQFAKSRSFDYGKAMDGMRQILWGFFKKVVVADNCAVAVTVIFNHYTHESGSTLLLGAVLFTFQIYGDFSGYSDIAIGTARLFGIDLMKNFHFPYFSRDIAEFWRRWHISLNTWFRDYVYIPLGGSRGKKGMVFRNTMVIFLLSGLWHGANWTFIVWGAYHAFLFLPLLLLGKNRKYRDTVARGRFWPNGKEVLQMGVTFGLVMTGWVIFRAENMTQAIAYLRRMFSASLFSWPHWEGCGIAAGGILILLLVEWIQRDKEHALAIDRQIRSQGVRWSIYYVLVLLILMFGGESVDFIYFQF